MIRLVLMTLLAGTAGLVALAEPVRHAITTESVAAAISNSGVQVSPQQVTLLSSVVAATDAPRLRVRSIDMSAKDRVIARLDCESGECLPFVVSLNLAAGGKISLQSVSPVSSPVSSPTSVPAGSRAPLVRKGSPATLLLNHGPVHISIPVRCLDDGASGQSIRASAVINQQVYSAQVVGRNVLSGRF